VHRGALGSKLHRFTRLHQLQFPGEPEGFYCHGSGLLPASAPSYSSIPATAGMASLDHGASGIGKPRTCGPQPGHKRGTRADGNNCPRRPCAGDAGAGSLRRRRRQHGAAGHFRHSAGNLLTRHNRDVYVLLNRPQSFREPDFASAVRGSKACSSDRSLRVVLHYRRYGDRFGWAGISNSQTIPDSFAAYISLPRSRSGLQPAIIERGTLLRANSGLS